MKNNAFIYVVLLVLFGVSFTLSKDYCSSPCGQRHIGCNNDGEIDSTCVEYSEFLDISDLKNSILDKHNYYRNKIASGSMDDFDPAERMATMTWDNELAYLAGLNVKTCKFAHDQCRDTEKYRHSGQNLAYTWMTYKDSGINNTFMDAIDNWFAEYEFADMDSISMYGRQSPRSTIGHFTVMVADRNIRTGCAALRKVNKENSTYEYVMACNYATTNIINRPIYKAGRAASKCITGKNPKYRALCSTSESIDPNNLNYNKKSRKTFISRL